MDLSWVISGESGWKRPRCWQVDFPFSCYCTYHAQLSKLFFIKCGLLLSCSITPASKQCFVLLLCKNVSSSSFFFNRQNAFKFLVWTTNQASLRHETPFKSFQGFRNCLLYKKFTRLTCEVILYFCYWYIVKTCKQTGVLQWQWLPLLVTV